LNLFERCYWCIGYCECIIWLVVSVIIYNCCCHYYNHSCFCHYDNFALRQTLYPTAQRFSILNCFIDFLTHWWAVSQQAIAQPCTWCHCTVKYGTIFLLNYLKTLSRGATKHWTRVSHLERQAWWSRPPHHGALVSALSSCM
jgi:hypothetical protein